MAGGYRGTVAPPERGALRVDYRLPAMSKRTQKKKHRARNKKANHGKKPNCGRK